MKKNALVVVVLLMVFAFAGIGFAAESGSSEVSINAVNPKITHAQAKEIALKKVSGKLVEHFVSDDENGKVLFYIFVIKLANGKQADVMISAENGEVVSVEEYDPDGE